VNKKARIGIGAALVFIALSVVSFMYFISADEVKTFENGVQFNFIEDSGFFYNFSINASVYGEGINITQINITFPSGFSLVNSTNGTSGTPELGLGVNATFIVNGTNNFIVWENLTHFIVNGTNSTYFWINASIATPGSYNISVATRNASGITYTNISVKINDTTVPSSIAFQSLAPSNNSIVLTSVVGNISAVDNGNISALTVRLYNSSGSMVNSSTNNSGLSAAYVSFNFTGHSAGTYFLNATVNDTYNNANLTGAGTRTIILATSSFVFNGSVKDENGALLDNYTTVNLTIRDQNSWGVVGYAAITANTSGWFNFTVPLQSTWLFEPVIIHRNLTTSTVDFRSKSIPAFPSQMMGMLAGTTFYLTPAGTINITAVNSTGGRTTFQYQIKDTKLGYPIASEFTNSVSEVNINLPRNRNYSIMVYPSQSMPVSFNWNNFSSTGSYNLTDSNGNNLTTYNSTTYTLHKQFNISMVMRRVFGFFNATNVSGGQLLQLGQNWTNLTVIPYLIEPGNMIHSDYGDMPYNLSGAIGESDLYNLSNGLYNISLPGTVETSNMMLLASGVYNVTSSLDYYGSFRNLSLGYATGVVLMNFTNISALMGTANNVSMMRIDGGEGTVNIPTVKQKFNIVNASNSTLASTSAHVELTLDYSAYGSMEFTWMTDVDQSASAASFYLPLLNSTGYKEANIFVNGGSGGGSNDQYAPRRAGTATAAQIATNNNFTVKPFSPGALDGTIGSSISIALFISNSTCDVPSPPSGCILGDSSQNMATFNPMQAVMGGGKVSFRMGMGGVLVHYVNVDMLASGPPDALFEDNSDITESTSGGFGKIMRFGSQGPTIYDYVLVSMPYTEGNVSAAGLDESAAINMSIPVYYDDNWNVIWNSSLNGSNVGAFSGNYSHYSTYASDWSTLMNQSTCSRNNVSNAANINGSSPCALDTLNNRIWVRLPHFSGTGASISGTAIAPAAVAAVTTSDSPGKSSGMITIFSLSESNLKEGYTRELKANQQVSLRIGGDRHTVGVESVASDSAVIIVASTPQKATLKTGETKKFDINEDSYYDLQVTLNSIKDGKAGVTIIGINEKVSAGGESGKVPSDSGTKAGLQEGDSGAGQGQAPLEEESEESNAGNLFLIILVVVIVIAGVFLAIRHFSGAKNTFSNKVHYRHSS